MSLLVSEQQLHGLDPKPWLEVADQLMLKQEMLMAIDLLTKMLPPQWRFVPPPAIVTYRDEILRKKMTAVDYVAHSLENNLVDKQRSKDIVASVPRGNMTMSMVKQMNDRELVPHIIDYGPGEFWLPIGLLEHGLKFTYRPIFLNKLIEPKVKAIIGDVWQDIQSPEDRPAIYVATEILEHLERGAEDMRLWMARCGRPVDYFMFTTPQGTYLGGDDTWKLKENDGLCGHIKAYTNNEFLNEIMRWFPYYNLTYGDSDIMMILGKNVETKFGGFSWEENKTFTP